MLKKLVCSKDIVIKHNIPYPTITHYTNLGLFRVVGRRGNKRLYDEEEIKLRIKQIRKLMNEGYPLILIRKELAE